MLNMMNWFILAFWNLFRGGVEKRKERLMNADSVAAGHEVTDWNTRIVFWVGIGFSITAFILLIGLAGIEFWWRGMIPASVFKRSSGLPEARTMPPAPQLQLNDRLELEDLRRRHEVRLRTYGWVDQKEGIAHIPIEEAMKRFLQRGHR